MRRDELRGVAYCHPMPTKGTQAAIAAARTAKWATIMAKWAVSHSTGGKQRGTKRVVKWQLVEFRGPNGGESRGIVDAIAIRKDHRAGRGALERGDRLEIVLLQVKGGRAPWPTESDVARLVEVRRQVRAIDIVLVRWRRKTTLEFYRLDRRRRGPRAPWHPTDPETIFGLGRPRQKSHP